MIHGFLSPTTTGPITEHTISPRDRPISLSVALSHNRVEQAIRRGDRGAAVTVSPPHAFTITPPFPECFGTKEVQHWMKRSGRW